jgi:hypothetical protein
MPRRVRRAAGINVKPDDLAPGRGQMPGDRGPHDAQSDDADRGRPNVLLHGGCALDWEAGGAGEEDARLAAEPSRSFLT